MVSVFVRPFSIPIPPILQCLSFIRIYSNLFRYWVRPLVLSARRHHTTELVDNPTL